MSDASSRMGTPRGTIWLLLALQVPAVCASAPVPGRPARATRPVAVSPDLLASADATAAGTQPETQAEPHLAANPEDTRNLVGGWQEQRFSDGGARALGFAWTKDGGRNWESGVVPGLTTASGGDWERATDPWLAFGRTGRVYYSSMAFGGKDGSAIGVSVSEDGGRAWSPPVVAYTQPRDFSDKQAIVVDTGHESPWQDRVHLAWMAFRYDDGGALVGQVLSSAVSDDGGATWSSPIEHRVSLVNTGPVPRVGPEGIVYLVWLSQAAGEPYRQIYFSRSQDGGSRWSRPKRIEQIASRGILDVRAGNDLVAFAVDPTTGMLYLLWADRRFTGVDHMAVMTSTDRGRTWSDPWRVSDGDDFAAVFTPTLAIDDRPGAWPAWCPERARALSRRAR